MAKAKVIKTKDEALVKRATAAALEPWEEEAAKHALDVRSQETAGVPRIGTKGGVFKIDTKVIGQKLVVVAVAAAKEKAYYGKPYDPQTPATPDCYAFTDDKNPEAGMVAHPAAPNKQNLQADGTSPCNGCKWNEFNTAVVGRGKRCKDNRRWLVITPVQEVHKGPGDTTTVTYSLDPAAVQRAEKRQLSIPPASLKGYSTYLSSLADKTRTGSLHEMITELTLYSLEHGGHGVSFEAVKGIDKETHKAVLAVGAKLGPTLMQPYPVIAEDAAAEENTAKTKKMRSKLR